MKRRIIAVVVATMMAASIVAGCGDEKTSETAETSIEETEEAAQTTVEETEVEETEATEVVVEETEAEETEATETEESEVTPVDHDNTIPQPGDTYNGHTVDHTEDQPNCGDSSHGTIFIFYTDSEDIDFVEY